MAGSGTKNVVPIKIYYGTGNDGTETCYGLTHGKVYLNSHSKTDFNDVRFTSNTGDTVLDYWLDEKTDSNYAIFYVEISADTTTNDPTIYIYYGKSDATTVSSITATFEDIADDFELGNLTRWTGSSNYSGAGTTVVKHGSYGGYNTAGTGYAQKIFAANLEYPHLAECWIRATATNSDTRLQLHVVQANLDVSSMGLGGINGYCCYVNAGGTWTSIVAFSINTWYRARVIQNSIGNSSFYLYAEDGSLVGSAVGVDPWDYAGGSSRCLLIYAGVTAGTGYHDDVHVRKYYSSVVSSTTWGTEESVAGTEYPHTLTETVGCIDSKSYVRSYVYSWLLEEIVGAIDSESYIKFKTLAKLLTETVGGLDSYTRVKTIFRTYTESLKSVDSRQFTKTIYRLYNEIVGPVDTSHQPKTMSKVLIEIVGSNPLVRGITNIVGSRFWERPRQRIVTQDPDEED
jgi:hypothetical protein